MKLFLIKILFGHIGDDAKDLIKSLLKADPKKRITITGVLRHPWFRSLQTWAASKKRNEK